MSGTTLRTKRYPWIPIKDDLISVTYSNGVLTVNSIKSIESYYERSQRIDSGRTTAYFNKFRLFRGPTAISK